jgi:hypothetical protein
MPWRWKEWFSTITIPIARLEMEHGEPGELDTLIFLCPEGNQPYFFRQE